MRRLKPDPVPDELLRKILEAGTAAPSGGNAQLWRFLVVTDPEVIPAEQRKKLDLLIGKYLNRGDN